MTKRLFCSDVEGDDLLQGVTKLHCASYQELTPLMQDKGKLFTKTKYEDMEELFGNPDNIMVMHNGIAYDKPAIEKVLGFKVEAEIIDTLFLSWYLYPRMVRHGLAVWGEEFGVPKPKIDDWEGLSLKEYIHRCEEDVKIQTALWKQIWKHLILLYGNAEGAWHLIRHLNFKAKCAAMQEKSRWKLDIPAAEKLQVFFDTGYDKAKEELGVRMPKVPVKAKKTKPKKCFKTNGSLSAIGQKWSDLVLAQIPEEDYDYGEPVDYDGTIEIISKYKEPNAGSSSQLKAWLDTMGWIPESFSYVRNKETNETRQIPQIKNEEGLLCASIERLIQYEPALEYLGDMSILKHRGGICKGLLNNIDEDGYVYAAIQGLTNTLRFKHKICVNLPSTRKPYGKEIRGLLIARSTKTELCGSDMSSLEDRTKQHYMWKHDPEYVREMQVPGFDPHIDMAVTAKMMNVFEAGEFKRIKKLDNPTDAEKAEYFRLSGIRHPAKTTNYAATYGARGPTIARAAGCSEVEGDMLYEAYWKRNWSITAIADECLVKNSRGMKWLYNPVGKIWLFLKADKDRFSTLNQGTGTYCFDRWVFHILSRRPQLTAQFHDEVILELKKGNQEAMTKILKDAIHDVNDELKLNRELDCDVDYGASYAEIH